MATLSRALHAPQIGPVAFERPFEEGLHALVDFLAQFRDLALREEPHRPRDLVDPARRHPADPGLLDDGDQRLFRRLARLQERREVAAGPQLRDLEIERAKPRVERAVAVAVAPVQPIGGPFVPASADQPLIVKFYAEAEDILSHLPKLGIPMIMCRIEKGERKGDAKVRSYPGMEKAVQQLRKKIDGVSELFTLDACRHGGMTELEEAELTDGQGRALSGHKTAQTYRGYAEETMKRALAATRKRHAHLLAQRQLEEQIADETHQAETTRKITA